MLNNYILIRKVEMTLFSSFQFARKLSSEMIICPVHLLPSQVGRETAEREAELLYFSFILLYFRYLHVLGSWSAGSSNDRGLCSVTACRGRPPPVWFVASVQSPRAPSRTDSDGLAPSALGYEAP